MIGIVFILLAILFYAVVPARSPVSNILLLVCGLFVSLTPLNSKYHWIKDRKESKQFGETVIIEFREDGIHQTGPFGKAELLWEGLDSAVATENGLLLKQNKVILIYVPDSALEPIEAKKRILERLNQALGQAG